MPVFRIFSTHYGTLQADYNISDVGYLNLKQVKYN